MLTLAWAQLTLQLGYWMLPPAVCVGPALSDSASDRTNSHKSLTVRSFGFKYIHIWYP